MYLAGVSSPSAVVSEYLGAFTRNDPDAIAGYVSEGFRNEHLSELGSSCVGRAEYRRRLPHFLASFTDRRYSIVDVIEQRRDSCTEVAVRYRFEANYDGILIEIPGVMWFSVRDDLITKRVDTWDSLTFLKQTGQHD
jgi:hypothetical protein